MVSFHLPSRTFGNEELWLSRRTRCAQEMCEVEFDCTHERTSVRIDGNRFSSRQRRWGPGICSDIQGVSHDSLFDARELSVLKSWVFRPAKETVCLQRTAAFNGERCRQHPLGIEVCEMYEVDSDCTQAEVSALIDMTIRYVGLSFC